MEIMVWYKFQLIDHYQETHIYVSTIPAASYLIIVTSDGLEIAYKYYLPMIPLILS